MTTSRRARLGLLGGIVLAVGWLVAPVTVVAGDPCYHGFDFPQRTVAATSKVSALNCAFAPTVARIPVGGTVTFKDSSGFGHLVTGANQEWGERDKELPANGTVSYTFDEAGIYPYACAIHTGMSGTVTVGEGNDGGEAALAAPVAATTPPGAGGDATGATLLAGRRSAGCSSALRCSCSRRGVAPRWRSSRSPSPAARSPRPAEQRPAGHAIAVGDPPSRAGRAGDVRAPQSRGGTNRATRTA